MRSQLASLLKNLLPKDPNTVFLTGDLGFMALEDLRVKLGERCINCGIAEQNMISMAAGLSSMKLRPWVYSIAPFIYARCYEQLRNDVNQHRLPINIIGNGGGYGYGVMGPTHHALEDYGLFSTLENFVSYIPAFNEDLLPIVKLMLNFEHASYLRLGYCEKPKDLTLLKKYTPMRKLIDGDSGVYLAVGPLAGALSTELLKLDSNQRPSLYVLTELPLKEGVLSSEFLSELKVKANLKIYEEHVENSGAGQQVISYLTKIGIKIKNFEMITAKQQIPDRYGSQKYHRGIDGLLTI